MNSSKTKLKVDQDHVETVIPPIGDPVLIVNGAYRGEVAILKEVDKKRSRVDIVIESASIVLLFLLNHIDKLFLNVS